MEMAKWNLQWGSIYVFVVWPWGSQLHIWFVFVMCIVFVVVFTHAFCLCCSDLSFSKHVLLFAFSHPILSCMIDDCCVVFKMFQARLPTCSLLASSNLKLFFLVCIELFHVWCLLRAPFGGVRILEDSQTAFQKIWWRFLFRFLGLWFINSLFLQRWGFYEFMFLARTVFFKEHVP